MRSISELLISPLVQAASVTGFQQEVTHPDQTLATTGCLFGHPDAEAPAEPAIISLHLNREDRRGLGIQTPVVEVAEDGIQQAELLSALGILKKSREHRARSTGRSRF